MIKYSTVFIVDILTERPLILYKAAYIISQEYFSQIRINKIPSNSSILRRAPKHRRTFRALVNMLAGHWLTAAWDKSLNEIPFSQNPTGCHIERAFKRTALFCGGRLFVEAVPGQYEMINPPVVQRLIKPDQRHLKYSLNCPRFLLVK